MVLKPAALPITLNKLPREFYLRPTLNVARDLLGMYLVRIVRGKPVAGMIVETEGYIGETDPASHSYRGKTLRNEVMFRNGGFLYVYFTYGMHFCCNVVTEEEGKGRAVLIRALQPVAGIEVMQNNRRQLLEPKPQQTLTNGPAKLCEALDIKRAQNGTDLLGNDIFIVWGGPIPRRSIVQTTRIGIKVAAEKEWRYYIKGNAFVSKTIKPE